MVEFLLGKVVDPNPRNDRVQSLLFAAASWDKPACVALLLERIDIENEIAAGSLEAYLASFTHADAEPRPPPTPVIYVHRLLAIPDPRWWAKG
jgi:hypothetical protein